MSIASQGGEDVLRENCYDVSFGQFVCQAADEDVCGVYEDQVVSSSRSVGLKVLLGNVAHLYTGHAMNLSQRHQARVHAG